MATEANYELKLLDLSSDGIDAMTALLQDVFPGSQHMNRAVVDWEYNQNPDGPAVGFNAWAGNVLAGHYVTLPLKAIVNGKEEKGLLSLNTATHQDHRGKGLFTKLANATYDHAAQNGFGFVIGVANANSTHGFTKKLGFQLVGPLRAMYGMGPLPFRNDEGEIHYQRIWHRDALKWRLAHPVYDYEKFEGRDTTIFSKQGKMGARYVLGTFAQEEKIDLPKTSTRPLKLWIGLDERMRWKTSLFRNIPMRFRPSPLNLIFKDLKNEDRSLDPKRVRFQAIDFDTL